MRVHPVAVLFLACASASSARAQSFNLRAAPVSPVPSPSYGAATGQTGTWNAIQHVLVSNVPGALVDLAGNPTGASALTSQCDFDDTCVVSGFGPDVTALFRGSANGDCPLVPSTTRIFGLLPGHYRATLYSTPCVSMPHDVVVRLTDGSFQQLVSIGGTFNGTFASMQRGLFEFDLHTTANFELVAGFFQSWSALQLTWIEPVTYCTAKPNSLGCVPAIGWSGFASVALATGFTVRGSNVRNHKPGLLIYCVGGRAALPFHGGTLCLLAPIRRTPATDSGGSSLPANDCSGVYAIDMNAFAAGALGGNPLAALGQPGTVVDCQWWGRDNGLPAPDNVTLTDALEYEVRP